MNDLTTRVHSDKLVINADAWEEFHAGDWEIEPDTIEPVEYAGFDTNRIAKLAESPRQYRKAMTMEQYLDYIADMREQLLHSRPFVEQE